MEWTAPPPAPHPCPSLSSPSALMAAATASPISAFASHFDLKAARQTKIKMGEREEKNKKKIASKMKKNRKYQIKSCPVAPRRQTRVHTN